MTPLPAPFLRLPLAHRGLHDRAAGVIENSPAAIEAAIAAGYGIEIDLQLSRDGQAVVYHDYALHRLTGETGPVRQRDALDLGRIALAGSARTETIPTFAEVLALVAGRAPLLVEIKDQDGALGPDTGTLERAAARDLRNYAGPAAVMSFNPYAVAAFGAAAPDVPRGLTTSAFRPEDWRLLPVARAAALRGIPDFDRVGATFISHEAADLARPRVAALKKTGAAILCWTVRSPQTEAEARRVAHNITFEGYRPALPPG
ncbi:phosphodiesterase [Maritimibacter sp. 55A14]|uniref:glycerophosphodiester phosphodiesterase family protein n=1 Tax=Maritimibacter sp. 55A14 TaxID=2174844 RepID=UPI000D60DDB2|nr:glycerophosphodiester phosphodiesterase family protein [Maritimibacter sp. 55A14]PWE32649.1 phosphodiesterase [Maritimibacter sp. 55A14]